jgi:DNA invertase Pin-like site-specific DNA recombinase
VPRWRHPRRHQLDRLARSVLDARDIVDDLTRRCVRLNIGGSIHDPADPVGRLPFPVLSMIAEFEADLARMRTREGMAVSKTKGRLRGKQPKLKPKQEEHLVELWNGGAHTTLELAELFEPVDQQRRSAPQPVQVLACVGHNHRV